MDATAWTLVVLVSVDVTLTNEAWFGEQVKSQKKSLKLPKHAGQDEMSREAVLRFSLRASTCSAAQQSGPSA